MDMTIEPEDRGESVSIAIGSIMKALYGLFAGPFAIPVTGIIAGESPLHLLQSRRHPHREEASPRHSDGPNAKAVPTILVPETSAL